ncbi:MAG TPA: hypothetical protein VNA25_22890 [Phycisphaerae bacterium]|nr:hypothetical protein [Phycisphaerae bacterium]
MLALHRDFGSALRTAAGHAKRRGLITAADKQRVRTAVREKPDAVQEAQDEVLEAAFCRGYVQSTERIPEVKEIDCDKLMELLIQLLPILLTLF